MSKSRELNVYFGPITKEKIEIFRQLNQSVFPIKYNTKFYEDIVETPAELTKFAYFHDYAIGAISCRLEGMQESKNKVYIMTLGVLEPYRHYLIGSKLLRSVLEECEKDESIAEIYLHVQTSNSKAIAFYQSFGFSITDTIFNYYKDIYPPNCYVLKKSFECKICESTII